MFTTTDILDETCHKQARPTALLTTEENIMPLSWHMPVSKSPFRYAIAMRKQNNSFDLIDTNKEFALNFLDYTYMQAYQRSGEVHGGDKFSLTKLSKKEAKTIQTTLIEESYMIYECKVIDRHSYGDHYIFIADVTCIHNKDRSDVSPILFLGEGYYETTSKKPQRASRA